MAKTKRPLPTFIRQLVFGLIRQPVQIFILPCLKVNMLVFTVLMVPRVICGLLLVVMLLAQLLLLMLLVPLLVSTILKVCGAIPLVIIFMLEIMETLVFVAFL